MQLFLKNLSGSALKFCKQHRGRMKGVSYEDNGICFGKYALRAVEPGWIASRQIEAARRAMTRCVSRGGKVWVRAFPDKIVTERALGVRMGQGRGTPAYSVSVIKPGRILYELGGVSEAVAREAVSIASSKLPIQIKFTVVN